MLVNIFVENSNSYKKKDNYIFKYYKIKLYEIKPKQVKPMKPQRQRKLKITPDNCTAWEFVHSVIHDFALATYD